MEQREYEDEIEFPKVRRQAIYVGYGRLDRISSQMLSIPRVHLNGLSRGLIG